MKHGPYRELIGGLVSISGSVSAAAHARDDVLSRGVAITWLGFTVTPGRPEDS